jgi:hypothetical protein
MDKNHSHEIKKPPNMSKQLSPWIKITAMNKKPPNLSKQFTE